MSLVVHQPEPPPSFELVANCLVGVAGEIWIADSQDVVTCYNTNFAEIVSPRQECKHLPFRAKFFLTIAAVCIAPLLIVCAVGFRNEQRTIDQLAVARLNDSLTATAQYARELFRRSDEQLVLIADRQSVRDYLNAGKPEAERQKEAASDAALRIDFPPPLWLVNDELRDFIDAAAFNTSVAMIDLQRQSLLLADRTSDRAGGTSLLPRTEKYADYLREADSRVWSAKDDVPLCSIVLDPQFGDMRRCSMPIFLTKDRTGASPSGILISYARLIALAAAAQERPAMVSEANGSWPSNSVTVVLTAPGKLSITPITRCAISRLLPASLAGRRLANQ